MQHEAPEALRAQEQAPLLGQHSAPDTLSAIGAWEKRAAVLHQRGLGDEAEAVQRDVVKRLEAKLGAEHARTVGARGILADMVYQRGGLHEAEGLQRGVLEACLRALGPDAPSTLSARVGLANTLAKRGRLQEAEESLREVLRVRDAALEPSHPDTVSTRASLAAALAASGSLEEAEWLASEVCRAHEDALRADAPDARAAREFLAYVRRQLAEQREELRRQQQRREEEAQKQQEELERQQQREQQVRKQREDEQARKMRPPAAPPRGRTWLGWLSSHLQPGVALGSRLLQGPALLLSAPARLLRSGMGAVPPLQGGEWRGWALSVPEHAGIALREWAVIATRYAHMLTPAAGPGLDPQEEVGPITHQTAAFKQADQSQYMPKISYMRQPCIQSCRGLCMHAVPCGEMRHKHACCKNLVVLASAYVTLNGSILRCLLLADLEDGRSIDFKLLLVRRSM